MTNEQFYPKVRIASIIMSGKNVLLGEIRIGSEEGTWMFPWNEIGCKDSYYKTFFSGVWKDIGFRCTNLNMIDREKPSAVTNDIFPDEHYITLFHRAIYGNIRPGHKNKERYKDIRWIEWNNFPENISPSIKNLLKQEYNPFSNLGDFQSELH